MSDVVTTKVRLYEVLNGDGPLELAYQEEEQRIRTNLGMLRRTLNRYQRKILLHILDDMNIECEKAAQDYYEKGFRTATKLMIESLYLE